MLSRISLILVPLALLARYEGWSPSLVFVLSFLAIIPLAGFLGEATEVLCTFSGPKIGSLINATLGTLAEVIILFALLRSGQTEILKASIVGGILMSLLIVVGSTMLVGGFRHGVQKFDQQSVGMATTTMMLAVVGLMTPTFFGMTKQLEQRTTLSSKFHDEQTAVLSVLVALILFSLYVMTVLYQLHTAEEKEVPETSTAGKRAQKWSMTFSVIVLIAATIALTAMGEILSGAVSSFGDTLGLSKAFLGVVLLPVAGSVSELMVSLRIIQRPQINLALSIPINGAMQGALFVAPVLVFLSLLGPFPLTLYFSPSQVIAAALAVIIASYIAIDGVTSWLEGAQLLALWGILALWFFYLPPLS